MYIQEAENARYTFQHIFQIHLLLYAYVQIDVQTRKKIDTWYFSTLSFKTNMSIQKHRVTNFEIHV